MRVALVFNAGARSAGDVALADVADALRGLGRVIVCVPELDSFEEDVRRVADHAEVVCVAGGDGSLNRTVNALADRLEETTLALVPLGTGNDFARTLGLAEDPLDVARSLERASPRRIDVGRARGPGAERLFVNACMGGFPVTVDEKISGELKQKLGPLAFWAGGVAALKDLQRYSVRVAEETYEDCVALGIGNGRTAGGGIEVFPEADPGDGRLDACALPVTGLVQAISLLRSVRAGEHLDDPDVGTAAGAEIVVDADPRMEFNVDGELCGLTTPAVFAVAGKVSFLAP